MTMPTTPTLYDEDYTGPRVTYGLAYRPLAAAHVPPGAIIGSHRPHPAFRFGTIDYPERLPRNAARTYDLTPLLPRTAHCLSNACTWHETREPDDPRPFPDYCPQCWAAVDWSYAGDNPIDDEEG